jgi:hypothetical protein
MHLPGSLTMFISSKEEKEDGKKRWERREFRIF